AAAEMEKNAIVANKNYGYDESVVKVTGHARFDGLASVDTRKIIFMPTWRQTIAGNTVSSRRSIPKTIRQYSSQFKETDFFRFYNGLLTDEKILAALDKYDYTIE